MIPNIFHFIFGLKPDFGGKPFSLVHYLAVKSAYEVNRPEKIFLHYKFEPEGEWWEKAKPFLTLNRIEPPVSIFGKELVHIAHQADIFRLLILKEVGGIYLDMDTICVKPLKEFYQYDFVIGQELLPPVYYTVWDRLKKAASTLSLGPLHKPNQVFGLCNAVILSKPGNKFLDIWLNSYRTFRSKGKDEFWVEHSVKIPYELSKEYPDTIHVLNPYHFHYPLYEQKGLGWLFKKVGHYPEAYIHHLWETESWNRYLSKLTIDNILTSETTYNKIARRFL